MELTYCLPRADLRDYVRAYYYFATDLAVAQPMCAELGNIRINLEGGGATTMPNGVVSENFPTTLLGPTNGAYLIEARPCTRVFGIGILPRGWSTLLGVPAYEVSDQIIDLTAVAGRRAGEIINEIAEAGSMEEMAAAADRFFADLLARRTLRTLRYPRELERWVLGGGDLALDRLIDMMDVSRRQTDRLAKQYFGASPKLLQRKYRVRQAAERMRERGLGWLDAAGDLFYDQSHFIKEFKAFMGVTPSDYAAHHAALISLAPARRKAALALSPAAGL